MKVTLQIESAYDKRDVTVENETSIGRTDASDIALEDTGLSRKNTVFFIDEGEAYVADEHSLNGTFLNGEKVTGRPRLLANGDTVKIGSNTTIRVSIGGGRSFASATTAEEISPRKPEHSFDQPAPSIPVPPSAVQKPASKNPQILMIAAVAMAFLILLMGVVVVLILAFRNPEPTTASVNTPPPIQAGALIPVRVIDPLGGEDEDDLADLITSWEVAEDELKADNVADVTGGSAVEEKELNVTAAFLADRQKKAFEPRSGSTGIRPDGLDVPKELFGDGVIKQKTKLAGMKATGYR
ncbi:MAG: FHA domain-containing protein, partial [Pyrinomonadaceae bacterium]